MSVIELQQFIESRLSNLADILVIFPPGKHLPNFHCVLSPVHSLNQNQGRSQELIFCVPIYLHINQLPISFFLNLHKLFELCIVRLKTLQVLIKTLFVLIHRIFVIRSKLFLLLVEDHIALPMLEIFGHSHSFSLGDGTFCELAEYS